MREWANGKTERASERSQSKRVREIGQESERKKERSKRKREKEGEYG